MKRNATAYPYIFWMLIFTVVPLFLILYYSFTNSGMNAGPGRPLFTLEHFERFLDPTYIMVLIRSICLALISTAICLIIGYPMAMILARQDMKGNQIMVLLFIIPMWMNFLLRTYAWMTLLERTGLINSFLALVKLPPFNILYTDTAVVLGMVYNFLPFMVLPIYSVLRKIDRNVIEAAEDLGGNYYVVFRRVIFPLSFPGVMSGITMVFMPAVTTFVISRLLGGGQYYLIGNLIEQQFLSSGDWNFGSSLSIILMVFILISMGIMSKYETQQEGGGLW